MDSFIGWHARRSWRRWPHRRNLAGSHDPFLRADRLSGFVIRRRIRGGSEVDRGDAALRHRGGRADSDLGASGAMAAVLGRLFRALSQLTRPHARAPISSPGRTCAAVEEAVLCKCKLPVEAGVDHGPRPIVWALRRDGWRSCRRARRSGGSCPDRARDRGAPAEPAEIGGQTVHLRSAQKFRIISSCAWTRHAL